MSPDPNEYAVAILLPTVRKCLAERGDQRRAVLACIAAYHTVDYLAQAKVPQGLSKGAAKETRERQAQNIRNAARRICAPSLAVVQGICNGTKHAYPGDMRHVPPFSFGVHGASFGSGRIGTPGLEVEHGGFRLFVDGCLQALLLILRSLYGDDLDPLDLSFCDAGFRGQPGWQEPTGNPAV